MVICECLLLRGGYLCPESAGCLGAPVPHLWHTLSCDLATQTVVCRLAVLALPEFVTNAESWALPSTTK